MSRVLVTGGGGFIGSHVVEALHAAAHDVRVLDAFLPTVHVAPVPAADGVQVVHGDVRDPATVAAALDGVDVVCHQAALVGLGRDFSDAPDYVDINALGTARLLAGMAAAGVRRLVLAGSMVVYGEGRYDCPVHGAVAPGPRRVADLDAGRFEPPCPVCDRPLEPGLVTEDAAADPRSVYAATKLSQEHLAAAWARMVGGRVASLRYHNVYGPRMPSGTPYAGVASLFRSALERGEVPRVYEDGAQRRDFVHVRDVAAANVAALTALGPAAVGTGGADARDGDRADDVLPAGRLRAYNIGSGIPRTVGDMARALSAAFGAPPPVVTGEYRLGDVRHVTADSARADAELGWTAVVPFEDGVREFATAPLRPPVGA